MKNIKNLMFLVFLLGLAKSVCSQNKVSVDYGKIVWGQLNLATTVGYEDNPTSEMISIAIIRYDTVFSENGRVESVNAKDFLVKINQEDFKKMKASSKIFWVHAKWVVKRKRSGWIETKAPKDPTRPGRKVCLVFQFGVVHPVVAKKEPVKTSSVVDTEAETGCPTTPCPAGKVRNKQTCDCEPKSSR